MSKHQYFSRKLLASAVLLTAANVPFAVAQGGLGELEEVTVFAQKIPYRGDVPLESLPQQVQVLSSDLLVQTGKIEFQNALDLAGGIARQNSFGGLWDSFAIRGFAGDENLPSGYLINGFSGGRGFSGNRDTSNVETIEVLKGPGSALYGRGEPGGTINVITKKPQFAQEGYIKAQVGRYDMYRLEGDYTNALTESVAFRINGSYKDSESFRDTVEMEKTTLTPSFLFLISDKTSLNYELEYLNQEAPFDRGIVAIDGDPEVVSISNFYGEPGDGPIEIKALGHQFLLQHDLNSDWSILAGFGYRESSFEGFSTEPELSGGRQVLTRASIQADLGVGPNEFLNRQRRYRDYDAEDLSGRLEVTGTFDTGSMKHHFLAGVDAYNYELDSLQLRGRDNFNDSTYFVDVYNPVHGATRDVPNKITNQVEEQKAWGAYFQDQIDLSEQWKMLLGLRYDDFTQDIEFRESVKEPSHQSPTATSPRFGLVFEATENLSFYGSYAEGFRPNSGAGFGGVAFEPEESKSYELGMKWASANGGVTGTLALFKMEKSNIVTADPVNSGFSAALGEAESKGVELDISGKLTDTLSLMFNYAYVDAETTNEVINADWGVTIPAGSPLINIPENSANLMLTQAFEIGGSAATIGGRIGRATS